MRYQYEQAASYTRLAFKLAHGVSKYIIGPAVHDVLATGGTRIVMPAGRAAMGGLLRPQDEVASFANSTSRVLTEPVPATAESVGTPTLRLLDDLPIEFDVGFPAPAQPYEELVA